MSNARPLSIQELVQRAAEEMDIITARSVSNTIAMTCPGMAPTPKEISQHLRYLGYQAEKGTWRRP